MMWLKIVQKGRIFENKKEKEKNMRQGSFREE
jgi:hypothetical protein